MYIFRKLFAIHKPTLQSEYSYFVRDMKDRINHNDSIMR
jgi:hypothetical protein